MLKLFKQKKFRHGSWATIVTVVFIVVIVLINIIATMLFERFPITFDLTENSAFTISETTLDYIKTIDTDVNIVVMANESDFANINTHLNQTNELLKRYSQHNPKIKVQYVDMLTNPDVVSSYKQTLYSGDIVVEVGTGDDRRVKVVSPIDLVNFSEDFEEQFLSTYGYAIDVMAEGANALGAVQNFSAFVASSNAEQSITSAIMTVTDANPIKVTVLTGRGETDITSFTNLLDKNGYILDSINIEKEQIPEDTNVIVVAAPTVDYSADELKKIDDFLYNNGKVEKDMLYFASTEQGDLPNIDQFLAEWGIRVEKSEIVETNTNYYYGSQNFPYQFMVNESYRQDIANPTLSLLLPNVRPVTALWETEGYYTTQKFLSSSSSAVLRPLGSSQEWEVEDATERGTFDSFVVGSRLIFGDNNEQQYGNVAVVGTVNLINDAFITSAQLNNGDFILSFMNGMTQKSAGITIVPKTLNGATYDITANQIAGLKWTFVAVFPLSVLVIGGIICLRRRNR